MKWISCLLATFMLPVSGLRADVLSDLDAGQRKELDAGGLVVRSKDVPGGPWPELMVYTRVDAPVSAVESVFRDYQGAASYIPNLESAEVLEHPSKNLYVVRYTSKAPLVGKIVSTVKNTYSYPDGGLSVKWDLIEATQADESRGELRVQPDAKGCILRYTNYVKPKSSLAGMVKFAALSEVKKTVSALKAESEKRAGRPDG
jgi:hypothetical protein